MIIAVAYCGGCNPDIDREGLVKRLGELLGQPLVSIKEASCGAGLLLLVSGCLRNCLADSHPKWKERVIIVSGHAVDGWLVSKEDILDTIFSKIMNKQSLHIS